MRIHVGHLCMVTGYHCLSWNLHVAHSVKMCPQISPGSLHTLPSCSDRSVLCISQMMVVVRTTGQQSTNTHPQYNYFSKFWLYSSDVNIQLWYRIVLHLIPHIFVINALVNLAAGVSKLLIGIQFKQQIVGNLRS